MDALWQDLKCALRTLRKAPGFVIVAVLSLGVSLAAVMTTLAIVQAADLSQLPFKDSEHLVALSRRASVKSRGSDCRVGVSARLFLEWGARTGQAFAQLEG